MRIALVGGGTGGHIFPLLAVYKYYQIKKSGKKSSLPEFDFVWMGEKNSLEQKIAGENQIPFFHVHAGKLRRYFSFRTFLEPFLVLSGFFESFFLLRKQKIEAVFSKGGYVSLPVAMAARILRIPVYLHESDSIPGLANRLVSRFARVVFLTFSEAERLFPKGKTQVIGQILNPEIFSSAKGKSSANKKTHVLVIGGSQGSTRILEFILENIDTFSECDVSVVLGSLNKHFQRFFASYPFVKTYEFLSQSELSEIYPSVDVAITRAGATVLFELAAFHIRMIMIPLPESANNHQYFNAQSLAGSDHILIEESAFSQGAIGLIREKIAYIKPESSIDKNLSEKPLRTIFDVLTSTSALTQG